MNVQELIDQLQDMDPDAEVRLATQPSYPLQAKVSTVAEVVLEPEDEDFDEAATDLGSPVRMAVYLSEGGEPEDGPYLNSEAAAELGW